MRGALVLVAALAGAGAHMSMVIPTPRNAIDGVNVPEMAGGGKVSGGGQDEWPSFPPVAFDGCSLCELVEQVESAASSAPHTGRRLRAEAASGG